MFERVEEEKYIQPVVASSLILTTAYNDVLKLSQLVCLKSSHQCLTRASESKNKIIIIRIIVFRVHSMPCVSLE